MTAEKIFEKQIDDLLYRGASQTLSIISGQLSDTLVLDIQKMTRYKDDDGKPLPKPYDIIIYALPFMCECVMTEVEYSLKNLSALKAAILTKFANIKNVVFQRTITYTQEIHV